MRRLIASLAILAAGCGVSTPAESSPVERSATPSAAPAATPVAAADIMFGPADAPAGTEMNGEGSGADARLVVVISGRDPEFLALPGFVNGEYRAFSGDGGALLALALVFASVEDARVAYGLYLDELKSDEGYGLIAPRVPIGDVGVCGSGSVPTPLGTEEICLWRNGEVVLAVGGLLEERPIVDWAWTLDSRVP